MFDTADLLVLLVAGKPDSEMHVWREVAPGIAALLSVGDERFLAPSEVDEISQPVDALFGAALANVRAQAETKSDAKTIDNGAEITVVWGRNRFHASHMLCIDELIDDPSPYGTFVSVPFLGAIMLHVIRDARYYDAVKVMISETHSLHEGADPLSTDIFWWHDGRFTLIDTGVVNDVTTMSFPTEFGLEVVDKL